MQKLIFLFVISLYLTGCAPFIGYSPSYTTSRQEDPYREINEYNNAFFKVYHSDLSVWIGRTLQDLKEAFPLGGSSGLDVYGNGTVIHEVINPVSSIGVNARLIFYFKKNKIHNVVKE